MFHGLKTKACSTLGGTDQGPFLLAFNLPKTKLFLPIWATMAPKMKIAFELRANKRALMQDEKPHFFARNIKGKNLVTQTRYLERRIISPDRKFQCQSHVLLI